MALREDYNSEGGLQQFGSGIYDAIEGIANWIGLGRFFKNLTRRGVNHVYGDKTLDDAQLQTLISKMLTRAQAMGAQQMTELTNKLAQLPTASSPTLKGFISSAVHDLQQQIRRQAAKNAEIDVAAARAAAHASEASVQGSGDIVSGKTLETQHKAINAAQDALDIANGVEQKVR